MMRQRKQLFSREELEEMSLAVVEKLKDDDIVRRARVVLAYHPLPDEVSLLGLLSLWPDKVWLLPKVTGEGTMELRRYTSPDDLSQGAFGIMEPTGEPYPEDAPVDVALIPGMAFDITGRRLGRGKGYYDRFLASRAHIYKIGVCFAFQLAGEVPAEPHDVRMDKVVSSGQQNLTS